MRGTIGEIEVCVFLEVDAYLVEDFRLEIRVQGPQPCRSVEEDRRPGVLLYRHQPVYFCYEMVKVVVKIRVVQTELDDR